MLFTDSNMDGNVDVQCYLGFKQYINKISFLYPTYTPYLSLLKNVYNECKRILFYNVLHYKEGFQINVFEEKKMSYYLFTNIYSSVTTSQYLFMDGLVDCYEMILFILFVVICLFLKKSRGRYKYRRRKTYDMHIQFFLDKRHLIYITNIL